jgi:hypothetical protein
MTQSILALFAIMPIVFCIQDSDDSLRTKAEVIKRRTNEGIEKLEASIKKQRQDVEGAKRGIIAGRFQDLAIARDGQTFKTKGDKEAAIIKAEKILKEMTDRLAKLRGGNSFEWGTLAFPLKSGDFGRLPQTGGSVVQVVDDKSLLLKTLSTAQPSDATDQVVVMVQGIDTKGLAAGAAVQLEDIFEVTRTVQYSTASEGEKTVFLLVRLDTSRIAPFLK